MKFNAIETNICNAPVCYLIMKRKRYISICNKNKKRKEKIKEEYYLRALLYIRRYNTNYRHKRETSVNRRNKIQIFADERTKFLN